MPFLAEGKRGSLGRKRRFPPSSSLSIGLGQLFDPSWHWASALTIMTSIDIWRHPCDTKQVSWTGPALPKSSTIMYKACVYKGESRKISYIYIYYIYILNICILYIILYILYTFKLGSQFTCHLPIWTYLRRLHCLHRLPTRSLRGNNSSPCRCLAPLQRAAPWMTRLTNYSLLCGKVAIEDADLAAVLRDLPQAPTVAPGSSDRTMSRRESGPCREERVTFEETTKLLGRCQSTSLIKPVNFGFCSCWSSKLQVSKTLAQETLSLVHLKVNPIRTVSCLLVVKT